MMRRRFVLLWPLVVAACAHGPGVSAPALPLKRVVVYRNGVGYFERGGKVDGEEVEFKVRPTHVGDFLATLAIMERGGSSVKSVSFPLHEVNGVRVPPAVPESGKPASALEVVK